MKAAFAIWNQRIAPQFDAARYVCIVEAQAGTILNQHQEAFRTQRPVNKVRRLADLGVETLVCGAISRPIRLLLEAQGIRVIPLVAGELSEVILAWINGGKLGEDLFAMPGHRGAGASDGSGIAGRRILP
jgi:predicted Fe-Mo cluster-binding NifX family protein